MATESRTLITRPAAPSPAPATEWRPIPRLVPQTAGYRVGHGLGFWFVAAAFAVLMAFGTAPTPLWPLYAARDGFGATTITEVFAILVAGAATGFLALGHLSDRLGRRRVVMPALAVAVAAGLVLALWTNLAGLVAGRFLNGIGIGLMASTATTYLHDLYRQEHPDRPGAALPGVVATAVNLGGLALGPLVAGAIGQWLPHPLTVVQLGFTAALAVALVLVAATPETVDRRLTARTRPARFTLRPNGGRAFGSAAGLGFFSFALFGVVSSLGSVMLHDRLGISSTFIAGLAPFLMFIAAAIAQLALVRLSAARQAAVGVVTFPTGLALVAVALYHPTLPLYLVAVALAGAGAGLLFKVGVSRAVSAAAPASTAGVLAVYFVVSYVGMGVPSILFSIVILHLSIELSMIGFALVLSAGAALAVAAGNRRPGRSR
jgi:MFS family permease